MEQGQYNADTPADFTQTFKLAQLDPSDYNAEKCGILSDVITYHTPFKTTNAKSVTFSVALGSDMSVDTLESHPLKNYLWNCNSSHQL